MSSSTPALMENSLLSMPPLAWPSSSAAPRCSADLVQQKREQCRERVCERSDGKPLDSAELSAPTSEFDTATLAAKVRLRYCKTKFPSLAGRRVPKACCADPPSLKGLKGLIDVAVNSLLNL